ncbi:EsaB/YukD family protein [Streptomyces sp. NPDC060275]|uniref:EsaB/YukD family protein n=1 Tax=Streptomyces sp. NPDC060275 TaxID=3347090 RepID=UPI0036666A96
MVGARRRVDLAVPADAAIAEYTPALLTLVGQVELAPQGATRVQTGARRTP